MLEPALLGWSIFRRSRHRSAGQSRRIKPTECFRDGTIAKALLRLSSDPPKKDHTMSSYLPDLIYIAIGVASFAVTALYLAACASL